MRENVHLVYGPPGTGKTTHIGQAVREEVEKHGPAGIMISSFTRAAAAEIAGRDLPIHRNQVGTLHAFAYSALSHPELVVDHIEEWNDYVDYATDYVLTSDGHGKEAMEDSGTVVGEETPADVKMGAIEVLRAKRIPREMWPATLRGLDARWQAWKEHTGLLDFTDLIERARADTEAAPGRPRIGWFDEVQDFTPLELDLVRHWGEQMDRVTLVGDDDQTLYHFKGSVPEEFLDPLVPEENKRVLEQSYRLPRTVHAVALKWIEELGDRRREKNYRPRDFEGVVRKDGPTFGYKDRKPNPAFLSEIEKQVLDGRTVMIMASTSFMLNQIRDALKGAGIPFHNPWRRTRSDWNPLRPSRGTSSAERLLSYLILDERIFGEESRPWTGGDVQRWANPLSKGVFRRGATKLIGGLPDRILTYEEVAQLFDDENVMEEALEPSLQWYRRNLTETSRSTLAYPLAIADRFGPPALRETPKVVIGTIHSLKGSQADVVYLSPDLSPVAMREMSTSRYGDAIASRDATRRMFYVAMTRAREELVLCAPTTGNNYFGLLGKLI